MVYEFWNRPIFSERDPESALRVTGGYESRSRRFVDDPVGRRWERVLGRFVRIPTFDAGEPEAFDRTVRIAEEEAVRRLSTGPSSAEERLRELFRTVRRECCHHLQLQAVGEPVVRFPDFADYDPYRLVRCIRELADGFYRTLWSSFSDKEKLLLTQVAKGYLVNPVNRQALNRLLALRLILRRARFELVNHSFAEFVLSAARPTDVAEWEQSGVTSTWSLIRIPVLISLVGVAAFIAYTQRDALPAVLGILGAAVAVLVKLLDLFRRPSGQPQRSR